MSIKSGVAMHKLWLVSGSVFLILLLFQAQTSFAQYRIELTPSVSVGELFDDNIYLDSTNEKSDYITEVSPGLNLNVLSEHSKLELAYAPTFVWYADEDQNNTVRHLGSVSYGQELSQHWRLDLTERYVRSEEPLETTEEIEGVRSNRNTYERIRGSASLGYLFGPENVLTLGYRHSLLENEDVTLDDGMISRPFANVIYWFNVKNGLEMDYEYTDASFSRDDASIAGDDYSGNATGIRYIHRFTPHTSGSIGYDFTTRDFDGFTEDYNIHAGAIGFEHAFSPDFSISLEGGYFEVRNDRSDDEDGITYNASLVKRFERGSITIEGSGGWDEAYLESERRGLTRYWRVGPSFEYRFSEPLSGYVGAYYRQDRRDMDEREWKRWRGNCGLRWEFLDWLSLSLDYTYNERDDTVDMDDYAVNKVMLKLTAGKLFRWQ
jgi:hypothetical protein